MLILLVVKGRGKKKGSAATPSCRSFCIIALLVHGVNTLEAVGCYSTTKARGSIMSDGKSCRIYNKEYGQIDVLELTTP